MLFAGIDIGTTGSKITVFNDGIAIDKLYASYPAKREEKQHEIDAHDILNAVKSLIIETDKKYRLKSIGITSFGESFVLLDRSDRILTPVMLYTDPRGKTEAKELENLVGRDRLGQITGQIGQGMYTLPKLMYIKKHDPQLYRKIDKIFLMEDFMVYLLTGVRQIDYSLACRTLAFDVRSLSWSEEILSKTGIDRRLFSKPVAVGTNAGKIRSSLKREWNLTNDIEIISISHDQISNAIGGNVFEDYSAVDGSGTCECLTVLFKGIPSENILYEKGYGIIPYLKNGYNVCYSLINSGGSLLSWLVDNFFPDFKNTRQNVFHMLDEKISCDRISSVLVLPHFAGAGTPYMDESSKGMIVNLDLSKDRYEIYQATLQSIAYEMYLSLSELKKAGIRVDKIYASGGGASNDRWLQMKADILNIPFYQLDNSDAGTVGSGIIVGTGLKIFSSIEEGMKQMIKIKKVFYPRSEYHLKHMENYKKYCRLYSAMKELSYE